MEIQVEKYEYIGAFLNHGRHNMFILVNHLADKFDTIKCGRLVSDEQVGSKDHFLAMVFDPTKKEISNEVRTQVLNYICKRHYLPFVEFFRSEFLKEEHPNQDIFFLQLHKLITFFFHNLNSFRDSYSHFMAVDKLSKVELGKRNLFVSPLNSPEDSALLSGALTQLFTAAPAISRLKSIELEESHFVHMDLYQLFDSTTNKITRNGLLFFTTLFLEQRAALKLLKKFSGFKNETLPPFKATLKTFTAFSINKPQVKVENENKKQALLMEMLGELNKCPKEIFRHLSDEDKKHFEINIEEEAKNNILLNSIRYDEFSIDEIEEQIRSLKTLKRSVDRFPYFALRYIDELHLFKKIRFQITLGRICLTEDYQKEILGQIQNRRITKTLNIFGKLSDFENKEEAITSEVKKSVQSAFFDQFAPHYNINNNKIAFYLFNNEQDANNPISNEFNLSPHGFISLDELPKLIVLDHLISKKPERIIEKFLKGENSKILDIEVIKGIKEKAVFDPEYLTKRYDKVGSRIDPKELKTRKEYGAFIADRHLVLKPLLDQYQLRSSYLPEVIRNYLMNIGLPNQDARVHNKVKLLRRETKKLLNKLNKEQAKNKLEQNLNLGDIATYLTKDIINLIMDKDVKQKITSPYFNKLQNLLAYFSTNKEHIVDLLSELSVFNTKNGHVFLKKEQVQNSKGMLDFYRTYLEAKTGKYQGIKLIKKGWFDTLLNTAKVNGKFKKQYRIDLPNSKVYHSLIMHATKEAECTLEEFLAKKAKIPLNLPTTLFDEVLKETFASKTIPIEKTGFASFLATYLNQDHQPCYALNRIYKKPIALIKTRNTEEEGIVINPSKHTGKEINKIAGKYADQNEKIIRFQLTKDRVLKLMCEFIIKSDDSLKINNNIILLESIYPFATDNPLDRPVSFQKVLFKDYTITAENSPFQMGKVQEWLNFPEDKKRESPNLRQWYTWTIKDFGRFNKYNNDKRLPNLLTYFEDKTNIPYELLQFELDEYDVYWDKFFGEFFRLEKALLESNYNGIVQVHQSKSTYNEIQFHIFTNYLKDRELVLESELNYIEHIRNKFSHSEFPENTFTSIKISKQEAEDFKNFNHIAGYKNSSYLSVARRIFEDYNLKINKIIETLN